MTKLPLAFLGLGAMGAPMATRLVEAGFPTTVYDASAAAMAGLARKGATAAASAREAAEGASVVFACLPTPKICLDVATGPDGAGSALARGSVYVEMSTVGSDVLEQIAGSLEARGCLTIDAPVSGGPRGANAGTLSMIAAGPEAAFGVADEALRAITGHVFRVGDKPGMAQVAKLANNMISAAGMASAFEAVAMAVKAGLDAHTLIDVINASTGRNSATLDKFPASVLPRSFDYGGKLEIMYKDVQLCMEEARRRHVPMWVGSSVYQLWFHAMTQGRGQDDYTTLGQMVEGWAGVVIGGEKRG